MQLSDKTKIGMTIGQIIALIGFIFAVGGWNQNQSNRIDRVDLKATEAVSHCDEYKARLEKIERERAQESVAIMKMIQEIRESQIRIEGKLDLKQDRFK